MSLHIVNEPVQFMQKERWFWGIVTASDMWKETGWNSIIFLAAIIGIDPELHEAATVDGAGRFRRMWHITLPGIRPTIMVMLILSIGWLTSIGFEKQFLLGNPIVNDYAEVLELYVLNYGIKVGRYSYGTAIGIFNSVVSIILLVISNAIFKRTTKESVI
jgi:putative aldouronate transport system permease protein